MQPLTQQSPHVAKANEPVVSLTGPLTVLFAFAVCVIIVNHTAAQPLTGPVAPRRSVWRSRISVGRLPASQ